ncbi:MAG: 2-phospho-L-lactate transferase [Rhodocyclaceae bacterium]|nr:2-phospho-L-lactate transferase [Rhodocyclaceae bacterium]MCA3076862.1 2-phospho-L-lactate transferase [Rhodocyclaceae bacterium]MCA3090513.1 2-phospho-L-lactate transferase [Rhodocyclaceae bacterium]MCA3094739.1 2-phospho-L-lactate transferase [Rhodocyclaceae bacterium]MCA3097928.1 2-phospho-L-lactate transferase [Rhodocyclaceae bacterium]
MILALAGGVGGARLAQGLVQVLGADELAIVVNVGDDFEHLGFHVSPDLDTVMYTLGGLHNPETGWGRAGETWAFLDALGTIGGETWFRLGDRDLAVHVERTRRLRSGDRLSGITADLCRAFGIRHLVIPATDDRLRTFVDTDEGELAFQDYFVRQRCEPVVRGFRFDGAATARLAAPLAALGCSATRIEGIVLCPSNPWLSIAPMLALPALAALLDAPDIPVVAISPIVDGAAVKGPAGKIMRELGHAVDVSGVVAHYGARVDGWVIDERDRSHAGAIAATGHGVCVTDTMMTSPARSAALALEAIALLRSLGRR